MIPLIPYTDAQNWLYYRMGAGGVKKRDEKRPGKADRTREATVGLEPTVGVLQTPALTTWLRRRGVEQGAEDGIRTRDVLLGKEMLYH